MEESPRNISDGVEGWRTEMSFMEKLDGVLGGWLSLLAALRVSGHSIAFATVKGEQPGWQCEGFCLSSSYQPWAMLQFLCL